MQSHTHTHTHTHTSYLYKTLNARLIDATLAQGPLIRFSARVAHTTSHTHTLAHDDNSTRSFPLSSWASNQSISVYALPQHNGGGGNKGAQGTAHNEQSEKGNLAKQLLQFSCGSLSSLARCFCFCSIVWRMPSGKSQSKYGIRNTIIGSVPLVSQSGMRQSGKRKREWREGQSERIKANETDRHQKFFTSSSLRPASCLLCAALAFLQLPFEKQKRRVHHRFPQRLPLCGRLIANEGLMWHRCSGSLLSGALRFCWWFGVCFDCSSVSLQATSIAGDPAEALCNDTKDCKLPRHFRQGHWFLLWHPCHYLATFCILLWPRPHRHKEHSRERELGL